MAMVAMIPCVLLATVWAVIARWHDSESRSLVDMIRNYVVSGLPSHITARGVVERKQKSEPNSSHKCNCEQGAYKSKMFIHMEFLLQNGADKIERDGANNGNCNT